MKHAATKAKTKTMIQNMTLSAMFLALGLVLPFFTGQIPAIGNMLLPMHLPVFLCGLICGGGYGAVVGAIMPLFRSLVFGMPVFFPTATAMAFELLTYGLVVGLLYRHAHWHCVLSLYRALLVAMLSGRAVWGIVQLVQMGLTHRAFTWKMFLGGAFLNAIPGIVLQLVLIPAIMLLLKRTGLVPMHGKMKHVVVGGEHVQ